MVTRSTTEAQDTNGRRVPLNRKRAIESVGSDLRDAQNYYEFWVDGVEEALDRVESIERELSRRGELKRARDARYRARKKEACSHLARLLVLVREGRFELIELADGSGVRFRRNGKGAA